MWRIVEVRGKKVSVFMKCVALLSVSMSVERRKVLLVRVSVDFFGTPSPPSVVWCCSYGIAGKVLLVRVSVVLLEHLLLPLSCGVVHYGIESARAFVERVESVLDLLKRY